MDKELLRGESAICHISMLQIKESDPAAQAQVFDGPEITLQYEHPHHLPSGPKTSTNRAGLFIGLPLSLGLVVVVVAGLFIGMLRQRVIGIGNIIGRRNHGYGVGKSRRRRLGIAKKRAIRLEEIELQPRTSCRGQARSRDMLGSSGSLISIPARSVNDPINNNRIVIGDQRPPNELLPSNPTVSASLSDLSRRRMYCLHLQRPFVPRN
ncbi:hypothetical protein P171DRAFT_429702 [Karstenula rhodostoma CBS 690.94]|uniref:Uncharacterized protein n=1 Tax=Karstenula rhodostoma CBS 690.94 TaxID=1392251 RepID=A0A9P4PML9_9PLEO|nr:hypothetical protein P171DRAFT_429702 [Karstenula rhodostoma CBS 690.94]